MNSGHSILYYHILRQKDNSIFPFSLLVTIIHPSYQLITSSDITACHNHHENKYTAQPCCHGSKQHIKQNDKGDPVVQTTDFLRLAYDTFFDEKLLPLYFFLVLVLFNTPPLHVLVMDELHFISTISIITCPLFILLKILYLQQILQKQHYIRKAPDDSWKLITHTSYSSSLLQWTSSDH